MMQIRCQRCGWNFTLGRETIGTAVAESNQDHLEYYQFVCPNCRHEVKVQVDVLRRHLPADYVLPLVQAKPEPIKVNKVESAEPPARISPTSEPAAAAKAMKPAKTTPVAVRPVEPPKTAKPAAQKSTATRSTAKKLATTKSVAKKSAAASVKQSSAKKAKK